MSLIPPKRGLGDRWRPSSVLSSPLMTAPQSAAVGPAAGPLTISGTPFAATQGVAYAWSPNVDGGTAPYTFSQLAGTVPAGTSFSSAKPVIAGTPTTVTTYSGIQIRVTDSATPTPAHADLTVAITVSAALVLTNSPATTSSINTAYSYTPITTGGRAPITWAVTNKPAWATFTPSTGVLAGTTPGLAETDTGIVIVGTDADGRTVTTGTFQIAISASAPAAINALEVMGPSSLDPQGTGPWGFQGNGVLLRVNINATVSTALSALDPSKFTITVSSPGFDNNNGAGPIAAVTRVMALTPRAVLRRQANTVAGVTNVTNTTQICYQPNFSGGSITNTPSIGTAADFFLVIPVQVFQGDTITVSVANDWNGVGTAGGSGPAVTNSSTLTAEANATPLYGWFNLSSLRLAADTLVELQVFHRYAWMGGASNIQAVAGVEIWATDGVNSGAHSVVTNVGLSTLQTQGNPNEVFAATPALSGVNDTDGSATLGVGVQYYDGYIYPWRGTRHQISVNGVAWPTPIPETVLTFKKDVAGKYAGGIASVMVGGLLPATSLVGISTTYPVGYPLAAAAYPTPDVALKALAAWKIQGVGRPAGAITTQNNADGCRVVHFDNAGADQSYEMAGSVTPTTATSCVVDLEPWTGNTGDAFYTASANVNYTGGFLRLKMRANKTTGSLRAGDTTSNSVATLMALDGKNQTWGASTATSFFQNVAMVELRNVSMVAPTVTNAVAGGMGQSTTSPYRCRKAIGIIYGDNTVGVATQVIPWHFAGCRGNFGPASPSFSRQSTNDGMIVANNSFFISPAALLDFKPQNDIGGTADTYNFTRGAVFHQNTFECINTGGNNVGFQSGSTSVSVRNVLWTFNSGAHGKNDDNTALQNDDRDGFSICYRDNSQCLGTTADVVFAGNLTPRWAFKADYFTIFQQGGSGLGAAGLGQTGNFTLTYGVELMSNCLLINRGLNNINDASNFAGRSQDPLSVTNQGIVTWVDNRADTIAWASPAGFGDYHLKNAAAGGNNTGKGIVAAGYARSRYDQFGTLRKNAVNGVTGLLPATGAFEATD